MKHQSSMDMDLWKDVVARCIGNGLSIKASAKMADEACDEFRKRLSPNDTELIDTLEAL